MRVPLVSGITADNSAEFRTSYALNLEVVAVDNRIAKAQFRAPPGAISFATGPGTDRGGFLWQNEHYRVMGTKLVKVSSTGTVTQLGDVGGTGPVTMDEGFGRLAIRSGVNLYYWTTVLTQVTDPDLGPVLDMLWIDGYFMTTDGTHIIVTELNDPTSVLPLKYGSAEEDPDPVVGLMKLRNEAYVLGRYSIQVFRNVGGNGFPFQTVRGGTIPQGCVGAMAKCYFADSFAFVGSSKDEAIGVYIAGSGTADRISDRWVDDELAKVADPSQIVLENRTWRGERRLLLHLPDKTLVFLANASRILDAPVWYIAQSGQAKPYRLRNAVIAYGKIYVGDTETASVGELTDSVATHFGEDGFWQFDCGPVYNEGKGFILTSVELVGLPGRAPANIDGTAWMSMTRDGQVWSVERGIPMGLRGERDLRLIWRPRQNFRSWAGLRFRGTLAAMPSFAACEAAAIPLAS